MFAFGLLRSLNPRLTARASRPSPCRATSWLTVEMARCKPLAMARNVQPAAIPREISSHSLKLSTLEERLRRAGAMPPSVCSTR